MKTLKAVVLGAGGFIGGHLCQRLLKQGYKVRGVDRKFNPYWRMDGIEFIIGDLRNIDVVDTVIDYEVDEVYQLAAEMGGAGYIFTGKHDADIFSNSALINLNVASVAIRKKVKKIFYSSSACVYSSEYQSSERVNKLSESMAYPADPDSNYGWEKLLSERLYMAYAENYGLNVRIARFHNIYGPESDFYTGREKAPAAICRKVILAGKVNPLDYNDDPLGLRDGVKENYINIWGSGNQIRSFLYIDDCLDAIELLMKSNCQGPINIGSEEAVTINQLAEIAIDISCNKIKVKHIDGPIGVNGRCSDNTLINDVLGWQPKVSLREGMKHLHDWMYVYLCTMKLSYEGADGNIRRFYIDESTPGVQKRIEIML